MLYYLSFPLSTSYSGFNVFRYITFRAAMAALLALLISFLLGPWLIRTLTEKQIGQQIRDDGPACHAVKAGTPTMGGALIILALLFSTLMMADIANRYVLLALIATVGTGVVGFADDYLKLTRKNSKGPFAARQAARPVLGRTRGRLGALLPAAVQHRDRRAVHQDFSLRSGTFLHSLRHAGDRRALPTPSI